MDQPHDVVRLTRSCVKVLLAAQLHHRLSAAAEYSGEVLGLGPHMSDESVLVASI